MSEAIALAPQTMEQAPSNMFSNAIERIKELPKSAKYASAVLMGALAFGSATELSTAEASADTTPTVTSLTETTQVSIAGSSMSEASAASVTVLGNHRVVSKAKIRKAKKAGDCETVDGNKETVYTQGHNEKGYPYGRDHRTSVICNIGGNAYRAACGNRVKLHRPKKAVETPIKWVNAFNKAKASVTVTSEATALAICKTENTYAGAYGHGKASAYGEAKISTLLKAKGGGISGLTIKTKNGLSLSAQTAAKADAKVICVETMHGEVVPPKDGTQGPGTGTPGQPGGPGSGGTPGSSNTGEVCRDTTQTSNGDGKAETQGDLYYGPADQFGNCKTLTSQKV